MAEKGCLQVWNQFDTLGGSLIRIKVESEIIHAFAAGIDDSGGLRIVQDGKTRIIHAGRILRESRDPSRLTRSCPDE